MDDITENVVVGNEHRDINVGLKQELQIYLLIQHHNYICACKSVVTDSNIYAGDMHAVRVQLKPTCLLFKTEFKDLSVSAGLLVS